MADDARVSCSLPEHPKTLKLLRRLQDAAGWSLVCLILWTAANRPDGDLAGLDAEEIELAAKWHGETGAFADGLSEVRFLDGEAGSFRIHDWAYWQPWVCQRGERIEKARHAANARWERRDGRGNHATSTAPSMLTAMPTTQPNPTTPKPKSKAKAPAPANAVALPGWVPTEAWAGFVEMRTQKRKPLTPRAIQLIVKELGKLREEGEDVGAILDQSTRNSWQDVFPLKENGKNGKRESAFDRVAAEDRQSDFRSKVRRVVQQQFEESPPEAAPDPNCPTCKGTGNAPHAGHPGNFFRCACTYPANA